MRIDHLKIRNFKCFNERSFDFHPQFNLFVGENGSGKSSMLDALAVAAGSWFLGISGCDTRHILAREVRLEILDQGDAISFEAQFPSEIEAAGELVASDLTWKRTLNGIGGRTTSRDAVEIKEFGRLFEQEVRANQDIELPIVSYYGTGRLWQEPRELKKKTRRKEELSRFQGYQGGIDSRVSSRELISWLKRDAWAAFQAQTEDTSLGRVVKEAILSCVEGGQAIFYSAKREEVVVNIEGQGHQTFSNLSDGQRNMLAMVGDLAIRAARLNPHLGDNILQETSGIVLIDELDLHLHPKWQRKVVEDLRRTFPKVQFFATTHSPFIVQTLRENELFVLDDKPLVDHEGKGVEEIARFIMGVDTPEMSPRYKEMVDVAKDYFRLLEGAELVDEDAKNELKNRLESMTAPYSDNPAYVAFLEMKRGAAGVE